ncbi:MAG TPA: DNA polymerase III subunit beta, partial [Anaerovoracaceae bacterium]|nr:DNA polymerase III subunit beta [Anaerovoracaceae bacterium]
CLEFAEKQIRVVTSDGHRLSVCSLDAPCDLADMRIIVPRKGIIELLRLLGDEGTVQVSVSNTYIQVSGEEFIFTSKLIDGRYPDYTKVFSKGPTSQVMVDRDLFRQSLVRVAILSNEKSHGVKFLLRPGVMSIHATNIEHEQAQDEIEVGYEGPELEIGFNVTYFLDAINVLPTGPISITFADSNSSAVIESPSNHRNLYIVMPMRL